MQCVHARAGAVAGGERGVGVVAALVVVVLDVERLQLAEVDAQRAAAVVDVLSVQRLRQQANTTPRVYYQTLATRR